MDELLGEGIAAAKSGQREHACELLMRVVEQDEENILAWLWLSSVVDTLDDREICLENVLALDPTHEAARKGLAWIREQKEAAAPAPAQTAHSPWPPEEIPPVELAPVRKPASPAAAVLHEDFARRMPPPEPEPEPPPPPPRDEFEDEYQCPYCAAPTEADDRQCPACENKLWVKARRREERSSWLWVALTLQAAAIIWPAFALLLTLFYVGHQAGIDNFFRLVPVYLGLPSDVPPEIASAAFESIPRLYFLPFVLFFLFSLAVLVGLYLRWKPIFYLFLSNALLTFGSAITGTALGLGLPSEGIFLNQRVGLLCGGGGVILALLMFLLLLQIEDDFFFDEKRILLRHDRDAAKGPDFLDSGHRYAGHDMWAMAAIHLRKAAALMPHQIDPHLALSAAYLNLKRYELAASALEEARRINPSHPQIEGLATALTRRQATESSPTANTQE